MPTKKATKPSRHTNAVTRGMFEACGHTVSWWFEPARRFPVSAEVRTRLAEDAEERAREMIAQDYVEGELCTYWVLADRKTDIEFRGWWKIEC